MKIVLTKILISTLSMFLISASSALALSKQSTQEVYSQKVDMAMQLIFENKNRGERREVFDLVHNDVLESIKFGYGSTEYWKTF